MRKVCIRHLNKLSLCTDSEENWKGLQNEVSIFSFINSKTCISSYKKNIDLFVYSYFKLTIIIIYKNRELYW